MSSPSLQTAVNVGWYLVNSFLIFFMKAGFIMLEIGSCGLTEEGKADLLRMKVTDTAMSALSYWIFGQALYLGAGGGSFVGGLQDWPTLTLFFKTENLIRGVQGWELYFAFASNAATIVTGAVAGRIRIIGYLMSCFVISGIIHPIVAHWIWSPDGFMTSKPLDDEPKGWFGANGFIDFAGAVSVHLIGGFAALICAIFVGKSSRPKQPDNEYFASLGLIILWFGWYGFNASSTGALFKDSTEYVAAVQISITTTLSAATAGMTMFIFELVQIRRTSRSQKMRPSSRRASLPLENRASRNSLAQTLRTPTDSESNWNKFYSDLRTLHSVMKEAAKECDRAVAYIEYLEDELPESVSLNSQIIENKEKARTKKDELHESLKKRDTAERIRFLITVSQRQLDALNKELEDARHSDDTLGLLPLSLIHSVPRNPITNDEILEYSGLTPGPTRYNEAMWAKELHPLMNWIFNQCEDKENGSLSFQRQVLLENIGFRWDLRSEDVRLMEIINGILTGLVAITACGHVIDDYWAVVIGLSSVLFYKAGVVFVRWLDVEDSVNAFSVHGMGGVCGGLFASVAVIGPADRRNQRFNAAYAHDCLGNFGNQLSMQLVGLIIIISFTVCVCVIMYSFLWWIGYLAVDKNGFKTWLEKWTKREGETAPVRRRFIQLRQEALAGGYSSIQN